MKKSFITLLLLLGCCAWSDAANTCTLPDVPASRELAQQQNKPIVIFRHGSDWLHNDAEACSKWAKLIASPELAGKAVFGQYDDVTGQKSDVRKKMLPVECYNMPEVVIMTPKGVLMAVIPTKTMKGKESAIVKIIAKMIDIYPQFNELAEKAASAEGIAGAKAAGEALELLYQRDAVRCGSLLGIINKKDPEDTTGYRSQFALEHMGMYREINNRLKGGPEGSLKDANRDFDTAIKYVENVLKNKRLKGERRQQWLCGLAYAHRERIRATKSSDWTPCLKALKQAVDINPDNEYGIGAAKYHRYLDPDSYYVIQNDFYEGFDQTLGFEKEWRMDVSHHMKGPGTYTFTLEPCSNGRLDTRDFRVYVNGKLADKIDDDKKITKTVDFDLSSLPTGKAKVEVRLRATCRDGWFGCSGHIRMEKKQ